MSVNNSVEIIFNHGWRDAGDVNLNEDIMEAYGNRRAITNLIQVFLAGAALVPEAQNNQLIWKDAGQVVVDLTAGDEISCFTSIIHRIKMFFDSEYEASFKSAVANVMLAYGACYAVRAERKQELTARLADLEHSLNAVNRVLLADQALLNTRQNEKDQARDDAHNASIKYIRLRMAHEKIGNYWGLMDPSPEEQAGIDEFAQLSGWDANAVKSISARNNILEQAKQDDRTKHSESDRALSLHASQEQTVAEELAAIQQLEQRIVNLKAEAAAEGIQL